MLLEVEVKCLQLPYLLAELVDVRVGRALLRGGADLRLHVLHDAVHLAGTVVVLRELACDGRKSKIKPDENSSSLT